MRQLFVCQGDDADCMFFVEEGEVRITMKPKVRFFTLLIMLLLLKVCWSSACTTLTVLVNLALEFVLNTTLQDLCVHVIIYYGILLYPTKFN